MSKTKFDNVLRSALWHSYNCQCFYCSQPLDWSDLHIDHIIPEYLLGNKSLIKEVIATHHLSKEFDLNGLYNLVPVHSKCNLRKGFELFPKATTLFYLGLTNKTLPKIEQEIDKLKRRKNKGQIISKLQSALSTDLITVKDLKAILDEMNQNNWKGSPIRIPHAIEFIDEVYEAFYIHEDYSSLYDKKLLIGGDHVSLLLIKNGLEQREVSTLNEWKKAINEGYFPFSTVAIKMASYFTYADELLCALKSAKMPKTSFVSEPWINLNDIHLLSPSILRGLKGIYEFDSFGNKSIGSLVDEGVLNITFSGINSVAIEAEGMETSFTEQFRADFNADGIEDIFVSGWVRAIGGTFGYGFTTTLTRYSDKHLIEELIDTE